MTSWPRQFVLLVSGVPDLLAYHRPRTTNDCLRVFEVVFVWGPTTAVGEGTNE